MNDIIRIIKPLENSSSLTDGISETVNHEIKRRKCGFLCMLFESFCASMLGNILTGKGVTRAGKGVVNAERGYNVYQMDTNFSFHFLSFIF